MLPDLAVCYVLLFAARLTATGSLSAPLFTAGSTHPAGTTEAYASLFIGDTSSSSFNGLRVLARTVRLHDVTRPLLILVAGANGKQTAVSIECELGRTFGVRTVLVPTLRSSNAACLSSLAKGRDTGTRLSNVFTVFNVWNLTRFKRLIWVEADQMVLRPLEALWRRQLAPGALGAAVMTMARMPRCAEETSSLPNMARRMARRQIKWNTGVVLMEPNARIFEQLLAALQRQEPSYRCTDGSQTLWNNLLSRRIECLGRSYNCFTPDYLHIPGPAVPPDWRTASRNMNLTSDKLSCLQPNASSPHVVHFAGHQKPPRCNHICNHICNHMCNHIRCTLPDTRSLGSKQPRVCSAKARGASNCGICTCKQLGD